MELFNSLLMFGQFAFIFSQQQQLNPVQQSSRDDPRIAMEFNLPVSALVDTCTHYAEQKAKPYLDRIVQLEDEVKQLRAGKNPPYSQDLTQDNSNTGANSAIRNGCESNPCMNGARCVPYSDYKFSCMCAKNYTGERCQNRISTPGQPYNFNNMGSVNGGGEGNNHQGNGNSGSNNGYNYNNNNNENGQDPNKNTNTNMGNTGATNEGNSGGNMNGGNNNGNGNTYEYQKSCRDILRKHRNGGSKIPMNDAKYVIKPDPKRDAITVFCNMTMGGWTLVYAYSFVKGGPSIAEFTSMENAVTPIPNWPIRETKEVNVKVSTTAPTSELDYNAVDFTLWEHIGEEFLVKSTLTNWFTCIPKKGSLVSMTPGSVSCTMHTTIYESTVNECIGQVPDLFQPREYSFGPRLGTKDGTFYYWDASETQNFPTHNPCKSYTPPKNLNFDSPRGAIYLR